MKSSALEYIVKIIVTPFVLALAIVFCCLHLTVGTITYIWLIFRSVIMYAFAVVRSAYENKNLAAQYLQLITSLCHNYIQLYIQFVRIVGYIWLPHQHNVRFELNQILEQEKSLLMKNLWVNVILIVALTVSFYGWTFGITSEVAASIQDLFGNADE